MRSEIVTIESDFVSVKAETVFGRVEAFNVYVKFPDTYDLVNF